MNEFWALVGNTRQLKKSNGLRTASWWKIYIAFFCLLAMGSLCFSIYHGTIGPMVLLIFIPFLIFAAFGPSIGLVGREWSGQTVSWWLTLPYPRAELLFAKLVGMFIHWLKIAAGSVVVLAVFAAVGMLLNPVVWTTGALGIAAAVAVKLYILTIAATPLAITMGMLISVTRHSRLRPLMPIIMIMAIWLATSAINYVVISLFHNTAGDVAFPYVSPALSSINPLFMITSIVAGLFLSAIIFGAASYILAEQTEA
ncbi:MAG: hypothetical protein ABSC17_03700 [Thermacetogeniaceae bacterium]